MQRRAFITLIGGAAAWPLVVRAQQATMPAIGWMSGRSPEDSVHLLAAFRDGLRESASSKVRTSSSNIAGRAATTAGYPGSRRSW